MIQRKEALLLQVILSAINQVHLVFGMCIFRVWKNVPNQIVAAEIKNHIIKLYANNLISKNAPSAYLFILKTWDNYNTSQ